MIKNTGITFVLCYIFYKAIQDLQMAFVDSEKVFDRIPINKLFSALKSYGVIGKVLKLVEIVCSTSLTVVRVDGVIGCKRDINYLYFCF